MAGTYLFWLHLRTQKYLWKNLYINTKSQGKSLTILIILANSHVLKISFNKDLGPFVGLLMELAMDMQKEWERCSRLRSQKTIFVTI